MSVCLPLAPRWTYYSLARPSRNALPSSALGYPCCRCHRGALPQQPALFGGPLMMASPPHSARHDVPGHALLPCVPHGPRASLRCPSSVIASALEPPMPSCAAPPSLLAGAPSPLPWPCRATVLCPTSVYGVARPVSNRGPRTSLRRSISAAAFAASRRGRAIITERLSM